MREKIYSKKAVTLGALLGGPIGATYFLYINFVRMNKRKYGIISLITGILFTLIIGYTDLLFSLPVFERIPSFLIQASIVGCAVVTFIYFQEDEINLLIDSGSELYSMWNSAGRSIICALVSLLLLSPLLFAEFLVKTDDNGNPLIRDRTGRTNLVEYEYISNTLLYDEKIPEHEVSKIAELLYYYGAFDGFDNQRPEVHYQNFNSYIVKVRLPEMFWDHNYSVNKLERIKLVLENYFVNKKFRIVLGAVENGKERIIRDFNDTY